MPLQLAGIIAFATVRGWLGRSRLQL